MRSPVKMVLIFVVLIIFFMQACRKDDSETSEGTLNIGVLLPLTGTGESIGQSSREALNFAMQDIEKFLTQTASGYQVKLIIEDTQTDTLTAKHCIESLKQKGVQLVIGPYSSSEVRAVKSYVDNNNMLVVSPASVSTSMAIAGDNIYRLVPTDISQADAMDAWLVSDTVEILAPIVRDDNWGRELCGALSAKFASHGGIVTEPVYYAPNSQDFTQELQLLAQRIQLIQNTYPGKKTGIYLVSYGEGTNILSTASLINFWLSCQWYGSSGYANNAALLTDMPAVSFSINRHLVCPVFGLDESAYDKWGPLMDKLEQKLGRSPEVYSFVAYDALWLAILTYLSTGIPVQTDKLKAAFTAMADHYYGVTGRTTLNDCGDRAFAIYDFWSVKVFSSDYRWVKQGWYDNKSGTLERL